MSDRDEIERILYAFARGFDEDDFALLADCMTPDVELTSFEGATLGREAVLEMLRGRRDDQVADGSRPRHILGNVEIDVESDSAASARSAFALFNSGPAGLATVSVGTYGDSFVNDRGTWRIKRRDINVDRPS